MLKNGYDECVLFLYDRFGNSFEFDDAIELLVGKGESDNDARFLLLSLIRNGILDYVGRRGYEFLVNVESLRHQG